MKKKTYTVSQQTKEKLASALKQLMAQKPLDKITIQEITSLCDIKRQHFYYHFEDIYDLMRWMFQREAMSLLEQYEGIQLWQDGILQLFQYLHENREVCRSAMHSAEGRKYIKQFFITELHAIIHHTVVLMIEQIYGAKDYTFEKESDMLTQFYIHALVGALENWLEEESQYAPEEIVNFVDQILTDHLRGAALRVKESQKTETAAQKDH